MTSTLQQLTDGLIETDFLIVGGGLVGSMAAIRAKKVSKDLDVTVIDKATMEYSGDGVGLDNFNQIPLRQEDIGRRDKTADDVKKAVFGANRLKGLKQVKLEAVQMNNAYISQPILEEIGVKIGEDDGTLQLIQAYRKGTTWGRVEYDDIGKPIEPLFGTLSRATDLKIKLGTAVRRSGARVLDRTMVTSIITRDGTAVGATAVNVRTGKFLVFKAKAILLATGMAARLYPYPWARFPNNLFYTLTSPVNHGGGHIAAFHAGAKLYSMEMGSVRNVSKGINHTSGGGACSWYFKMHNSKGEYLEDKHAERSVSKIGGYDPGINFLFSPNMQNSEYEKDLILSAKNGATPDEIAAVYFTAATEPTKALKFHKLAGGLTNERPAECAAVLAGIGAIGGGVLRENEYSETGVKHLFAAGTVAGASGGGSSGFTWGCLIADHVSKLVKDVKHGTFGTDQLRRIEETRKWIFAPLGRKPEYTVNPLELEDYVRNVNYTFVGLHRVRPRLERAIELLTFAQKGAVPLLTAANPHELMRAIEVQQIIEVSQFHAQSALMRNESRLVPIHYREDYPNLDPDWDNRVVTIKKTKDRIAYQREPLN